MHAAVDIGVLRRPVAHEAIDHLLRHLARSCIVEIHQRLAADFELEDREVGPDALDVEGGSRRDFERGLDCCHGWRVVCSSTLCSSQCLSDATGMRSMISAPNA